MDALRSGISMIHQELNLVPHMTVAENIWLGREPVKFGFVDHARLNEETQQLLSRLNIRLKADRLVGELSIASQQMVEIAKAVSWNSDIVIMDEPTSALTETEVAHLFTIIRDLREQAKPSFISVTKWMRSSPLRMKSACSAMAAGWAATVAAHSRVSR